MPFALGGLAEGVAAQNVQDKAKPHRSGDIDDGVLVANPHGSVPENQPIALQRGLADGDNGYALVRKQAETVGNGGHEHMPHGQQGNHRHHDQAEVNDAICNVIANGQMLHHALANALFLSDLHVSSSFRTTASRG